MISLTAPAPFQAVGNEAIPTHRPLPKITDKVVQEALAASGHKMPIDRARAWFAASLVQQAYIEQVAARGALGGTFRFGAQAGNVTVADVGTMTQQLLLWVADIFENFDFLDVVTVLQMTGPTAYIVTEQAIRANASQFYAAGSRLAEGLDPSYTECPTEACAEANKVGLVVDPDVIEVECRRIAAGLCIPANIYYDTQYPFSLEGRLREIMATEMRRTIQGEGLQRLVANAGNTQTWNRTPAAGSYFSTANPNEWKRELWTTIKQADRNILNDVDGRAPATHILGTPDALGALDDIVPIELSPGLNETNRAGADEFSAYFGLTAEGRYQVFQFLTMPEDTILVMRKDDRVPTYIFAPLVMLSDLGRLQHPDTGEVVFGMLHLAAQRAIRPGRIEEIQIGA